MAKETVAVKATKILKSGKLGKSTKSFASIADAGRWLEQQGLVEDKKNGAWNVGVTSKNDDHGNSRKTAYGYAWSRE